MKQQSAGHAPLSSHWAFVVQFRAETEVERGRFVGRVEHVVSGQAAQFQLLREEFLALAQARQREKTPEYAKLYASRAGVEGCLSQAVRRSGLRRARYVGLAKTHLQNVLTAAINMVRISNWLAEVPPFSEVRL